MNIIQKIYIKNMCCTRCSTVIAIEMKKLQVEVIAIGLGELKVRFDSGLINFAQITKALEKHEFQILEDKEEIMVSKIKQLLHEIIRTNSQEKFSKKVSQIVAERLGTNYSHLSRLFTKQENTTIEKHLILLKIERVKELLEYKEPLSEISKKLAYSSPQHLSRQFKSVTGISVSEYRKFLRVKRMPHDKI